MYICFFDVSQGLVFERRLRPWHDPRDVRILTGWTRGDVRSVVPSLIAPRVLVTLPVLTILLLQTFGLCCRHV
jgi:hypothetical protein